MQAIRSSWVQVAGAPSHGCTPLPGAPNDRLLLHLPFVLQVARHYQGMGLPLDDLVMEGTVGLLEASRRFDSSRGVRFLTYAVWWIRRSIVNSLSFGTRQVRLPRYRTQQFRDARQAWKELSARLGREASSEDLAVSMGLTKAEAEARLRAYPAEVSLDRPLTPDGRRRPGDFLTDGSMSPEESLLLAEKETLLQGALDALPERERFVVSARFGLGGEGNRTLREIGGLLGLTKERVRQIEERGVRLLRKRILSERLRAR